MYLLFFGINSLYISFIGRSANDSKKWKTSASQFYNDMKQIDTGVTLTNNDITTSSDSNMYPKICTDTQTCTDSRYPNCDTHTSVRLFE